jgi:hypothetical protein
MKKLGPGRHRSSAGGGYLQQRAVVNDGSTIQMKREREKRPGRKRRLPGTWRGALHARGRSRAAGMFAGVWRPWRRNGDGVLDLRRSRLDSLYQDEEEDKAHLPVVLGRRWKVYSRGAMVRLVWRFPVNERALWEGFRGEKNNEEREKLVAARGRKDGGG